MVDPPKKINGGNNETINDTHDTATGGEYSSNDGFDDYGLLFTTVEASFTTESEIKKMTGKSEGELNLTVLEYTFG